MADVTIIIHLFFIVRPRYLL